MNEGKTKNHVKPEEPVSATKQKKNGDRMYLGPTIIGVVRHGTVFRDGAMPEKAKECTDEFPMMERLFVDVDKMPEAIRELKKKTSALKTVYEQTAQKYAGRG